MNPFSEELQAFNEASESWLPNYYTMEETKNYENGEWYKNIVSANFLERYLILIIVILV